jgi:putative oxygen-independent coproporphyrinogen III oxidase
MFGIYIHFPYCLSKCPYCDFASRAEAVVPQERYTAAVLRELSFRAKQTGPREADSIYFGGGTPSLWDPPLFSRVLREVRSLWKVKPGAEVTLEANPGTTDAERFAAYREAGVNRLSIGVQSFAPAQLIALGRKHSGAEAERAYLVARNAGFRNISLDLMHGVEKQDARLAAADAAAAVALAPEHISCYALTLVGLAEEVPMAKAVRRGELELPDDEATAEMGDRVRAELDKGKYLRYEISNYALKGFEAVHNSLYWRGGEYAAAGCGACGFIRTGPGGIRYANDRSPEKYMARVEETGTGEASREQVTRDEHLRERIFTGLRLAEGLDLAALERDLDLDIRGRFAKVIDRIAEQELGSYDGRLLRLNDRGLDLHSEISLRFF